MISAWRKFGFSMGAAGIGIGSAPMSLFLLFYLTEILQVRPALAGLVVALPKVWDVVVDPGLGGVVDQMAQRAGRRSPVIIAAAVGYCVALHMLFSIPRLGDPWLMLALAVGVLILSSVAHTALGVSHLALADDMIETPAQRTELLAFSGVTAALLTLAATALAPFLVPWWGGGAPGYSRMAGSLALACAIAFALFIFATGRYPTRSRSGRGGDLPWFQSLRLTLHNHTFYRLVLFLISFGVSAGLISSFVPYINQYILHGGATGLAALASIMLVFTVAAMPLAALLTRRLGQTAVLQLGNLVMLCSYPLMFAASFGPIWGSWLAVAVFGLGVGGLAVVLQSMTMDVAKMVLPGGIVVPLGFYLGIFVSGQKLGQSLGVLLAGGVLDFVHLIPGAVEQSPQVILVLRLGYTAVPFALTAIGALALAKLGPMRAAVSEGAASL